MPANTPIYVSPERAAELCGCSRGTIYAWIRNGTLRSTKIGGLRRIRVADIEAIGGAAPEDAA